MGQTLIDIRDGGCASIFRNRRLYKRGSSSDDAGFRWVKQTSRGIMPVSKSRARRLERIYKHPEKAKPLLRLPRRNAEDVAFYQTAYRIAELERKAVEWIGRGHDANVELGRIFIRLKKLVGHGHFEKYYEDKFGQPYKIAFRTAQVYMRLAREKDEGKCADPALFAPATDAQAVAIREATERARIDVAAAHQQNAGEAKASGDAHGSEDTKRSASSMCTCRLDIRMTKARRDTISALWRSTHRHSAESQVTDYLIKLCTKYEITSSDSEESHA